MDCDNDDSYVNGEAKANSKPFSIRRFVVDTRRRDIIHCWPFPKKYLQICLKYGISNVLPPFEPCINPTTQATTENVVRMCSDQQHKDHVSFENNVILQENLINDENDCYYDEMLSKAPCHESNLSFDYTSNVTILVNRESSSIQDSHLDVHRRINTIPSKRMKHKQRKCKRRRKKRSMSDILARAKPCTLEDCYRIKCNSINLSFDDDDEAIDDNLSGKNVGVLKIKFGGCISKSWNVN